MWKVKINSEESFSLSLNVNNAEWKMSCQKDQKSFSYDLMKHGALSWGNGVRITRWLSGIVSELTLEWRRLCLTSLEKVIPIYFWLTSIWAGEWIKCEVCIYWGITFTHRPRRPRTRVSWSWGEPHELSVNFILCSCESSFLIMW